MYWLETVMERFGWLAIIALVVLWGRRDRNGNKLERRLESFERQLLRQRAEIDALQSGARDNVIDSTPQALLEPITSPVVGSPIEPTIADAVSELESPFEIEQPVQESDGIADLQPARPPVEEELAAMRDYTLPYEKSTRPKRSRRPGSVSEVKDTNWEKLIGACGRRVGVDAFVELNRDMGALHVRSDECDHRIRKFGLAKRRR